MKKYGKTWWGDKWLNALEGIEFFDNRIPRGKTYANTGRVYDLKIDNNTVTAKVKGKSYDHYTTSVKFNKFTKDDKAFITKIINNSPYILSGLLNQELPEELYDKLSVLDIEVFPNSVEDITTSCNCPDYAPICKHIAALIYIITQEIDKDPFKVFKLHDCDLFELLDQVDTDEDRKIRQIKNIQDIISYTSQSNMDTIIKRDSINNFLTKYNVDFLKIPNLLGSTFFMLKQDPVFYEKDFKEILNKTYRSMSRYAKKELKTENNKRIDEKLLKQKWNNPTSWGDFTLNLDNNYEIKNIILNKENPRQKNNPFNIKIDKYDYKSGYAFYDKKTKEYWLYNFLDELKYYDINNFNYNIQFLQLLRVYTLELIINNAIIPELFTISSEKYKIRWIPANYNKQIKEITKKLIKICPDDLVYYNNKQITKEEQITTAISVLIQGFLKNYLIFGAPESLKKEYNNKIFQLFFIKSIQFKKDSIENNGYSINQWLSNFSIKNREYDIYLMIEETEKGFSIDLKVKLEENKLISINNVINDKKRNNNEKLQLLADTYLIKRLLPEIKQVIDNGKVIEFTLKKFSMFFKNTIPLFEIMGIKIILPKQLQELYKPKLALNLKQSPHDKKYLSLEDILKFDWKIALGSYEYTKDEFEKLLKKSGYLVKIRNEYIIINEKEAKSIIKKMDKLPKKLNENQLMQAVLTNEIKDIELNIDNELQDKIKHLKKDVNIEIPEKLNGQLRDYQITGYHWLVQNIKSGFGSILADDMGLGKTIEVLTTILHLKQEDEINKTLIVVPTSLLTNWQKEINKFTPTLTSYIYHGPNRKFPKKECDIVLSSYGIIRKDEEKFDKEKWDLLVIDEAQNIKNDYTQQTIAIKSIKSKYKIALTGTPIENRLSEYWSIFDFINKHYLGTEKSFRKNYIIPIEKERNAHALQNFKKITSPFILRRLKTDKNIIKDLPEKITNDVYCNLTTKQTALYKKTIDPIMEELDNTTEQINRRGIIFKLITALKQICNHPAQYTKTKKILIKESGKMEVLIDILDNIIQNNEKVIIFTQYVQMGDIIKQLVEETFNTDVMFLNGSVQRKKRDQMVNEFQNNSQKKIFIISLKAGGTGLNLTAAQNVIHYDLWWNPAVEDQATDRAYRIGQTKNVMVYRLITTGTFEEKINNMILEKRELTDITLESKEKFITEMDNDQLKEIFYLRK